MRVVKTTVKTYEVKFYPNAAPVETWGRFKAARERANLSIRKFSKCFVCDTPFNEDDRIIFITVSGIGNLLGCECCLKKYEESDGCAHV